MSEEIELRVEIAGDRMISVSDGTKALNGDYFDVTLDMLMDSLKELGEIVSDFPTMITFYIPKGSKKSDILGYLYKEFGMIQSMRSDDMNQVYRAVIALFDMFQSIYVLDEIPDNGLLVLSGVLPYTGEDNSDFHLLIVKPDFQIPDFRFYINKKFKLEYLHPEKEEKLNDGI